MKTLLNSFIITLSLIAPVYALESGDYKLTFTRAGNADVRDFHFKIGKNNLLATTVDSTGKAIVLHGRIDGDQIVMWAPNEFNDSKRVIQTYHLSGTLTGNRASGKGSLLRNLDLHSFDWQLAKKGASTSPDLGF